MKLRRSLLKDTVTVTTLAGSGAYGPSFSDPLVIACDIDETRRLVRDSGGAEVVSDARLHIHPDDAAAFTPDSGVQIRGRAAIVLTVKPHTLRGRTVYIEVVLG